MCDKSKNDNFYYLRKEPYEDTIKELTPPRTYMTDDIAIYKSNSVPRFYRQYFRGINVNPPGMKLYTCKTLKKILELRQATYDYCREWFDVYDKNGKVKLDIKGSDNNAE